MLSSPLSALLALTIGAFAQRVPPSSWPQAYPGIPTGNFSTKWQSYFEVTDPLPNVTDSTAFPLGKKTFAGNIPVNRAGHPNDTLFFWAVERDTGSLTASEGERADEPWLIWLNGGPGASSFLGFMSENGPLHVTPSYSIVSNNYSWDKVVDSIWIDQPVGTGYSTADSDGYIADEDQMGEDFLGFLTNLVSVFPSLKTRPLLLTGESYAGIYIPYITKAIFSTPKPPVNLKKIAIGDGAIGSYQAFAELPTVTTLEAYPQLIGYDTEVFEYFRTQSHLCGYDLNLTYPQTGGHFPSLPDIFDSDAGILSSASLDRSNVLGRSKGEGLASMLGSPILKKRNHGLSTREIGKRDAAKEAWKRDLTGRTNGTIDPYYGCFLLEEMADYASNFSFPWTLGGLEDNAFDYYDIPDALDPEAPNDPSVFLNDIRVRTALHAPTSKNWSEQINYPFGSTYNSAPGSNPYGDPSVESMAFMTELATNATKKGVKIIIYEANDDALVARRSSEVVIQNMTFSGIQGFTRQPSTPFYDTPGHIAGIVHQERGLTYAVFLNAGHEVPEFAPRPAFVFLESFIVGSSNTGLVVAPEIPAVGGEVKSLAGVLPGTTVVFYGSGTTTASVVEPSESVKSFYEFLATATLTEKAKST